MHNRVRTAINDCANALVLHCFYSPSFFFHIKVVNFSHVIVTAQFNLRIHLKKVFFNILLIEVILESRDLHVYLRA